jgi:hypothetical protein
MFPSNTMENFEDCMVTSLKYGGGGAEVSHQKANME